MKFVLLAAGKSKRLYKKIKKNKCLLKLGDKSIIENTILAVRKTKIEDISIVVGFKSEKIKLHLKKYNKIEYILNKKYNSREMLYSLMLALKKYNTDIFLGIGGGPEGVLAASALDAFNCKFQGRFLFKTDEDIERAKKMGIKDLNKKYDLNEIVRGDSIFCATGITSGDLVNGVKISNDNFITETLVTHKNSTINIVKKEIPIT